MLKLFKGGGEMKIQKIYDFPKKKYVSGQNFPEKKLRAIGKTTTRGRPGKNALLQRGKTLVRERLVNAFGNGARYTQTDIRKKKRNAKNDERFKNKIVDSYTKMRKGGLGVAGVFGVGTHKGGLGG